MHRLRSISAVLLLAGGMLAGATPWEVRAQNAASDLFLAEVVGIVAEEENAPVPGLNARSLSQTLDAVIVSGAGAGQRITVANNYLAVGPGDRFIALRTVGPGGDETFYLQDIDRRVPTAVIAGLFALAVVACAGSTGARSLLSLAISLAAIFFVLVPLLARGAPPVVTTVAVASVVLAGVMYVTHGFRRATHAAFFGTVATVSIAGAAAAAAVAAAKLSGFAADEAVYLNASTGGEIDLAGLLLGAIIVGALGLLDDIAVTQAATVAQLKGAAPHLTNRELYTRAMAVGREHIGALVNTLALAYVGVSLPLLMLASRLDTPWWMLLNQEVFATEIVRTAVGGIALVLAVPLSTLFAIRLVRPGDAAHAHAGHVHHHEKV